MRCAVALLLSLAACPESSTVDARTDHLDGGAPLDSAGVDGNSGLDRGGADAMAQDAGARDQAQPDTYVLRCPDDDVYEPNEQASEAFALAAPGPLRDTISCDAEDWYAITVPAGFGLGVRLEQFGALDLDLYLYLASDTANPVDSSTRDAALETVFIERAEQATDVVLRVVNNDTPDSGPYRLVITFYLDGTCASDTAQEPNDTPTSAATLIPPVTDLALHACDQDDWYGFSVVADTGVRASLDHDPAAVLLALGLFTDADTTTPLSERSEYAPHKEVTHEIFRQPTEVLLRVRNLSYPGPRGDYRLGVELHPGGYCVDDGHEPNNDAASAHDLDSGLVAGVLCRDDEDYYSFSVATPGPSSRVVVAHPGFDLDVNLSLQGGGAVGSRVVDGGTTTITFTSAVATRYILRLAKNVGEQAVAASYNIAALKGTPPANDSCATAVDLSPGAEPLAGTNRNAYDDVRFAAGSASCSSSDSDGPDVFYRVQVPDGQMVTAKATMRDDLLVYLVDDCAARCCFGGADAEGADPLNDKVETTTWTNSTGSTQTVYFAVDSRGPGLEGDFTVEVGLGAAGGAGTACVPDQAPDAGAGQDASVEDAG
ncbi:MAG: hypothetical protein ABIJ09_24575 [Pseudomonadota bacterium]